MALLYKDDAGGVQDTMHLAVTDELSWQAIWERVTSAQPNPPGRPPVDFDQEMVLVVAAGQMRSGDQIHVDSVGVRSDVLLAYVSVTEACEQFDIAVYPVEVVRVSRSDKQVQFVERRRRPENCP
jgi:hypothetical protein